MATKLPTRMHEDIELLEKMKEVAEKVSRDRLRARLLSVFQEGAKLTPKTAEAYVNNFVRHRMLFEQALEEARKFDEEMTSKLEQVYRPAPTRPNRKGSNP